LSRQKLQLYVATFFMEICYGLFLLVAAIMAGRVVQSPFILGLTGTVHVATRVAGNSLFGRWSDRIGRKYLMIFACLLFLVAFNTLRSATATAVFLAYFLSGVANSIFWPLVEAWIGRGSTDQDLMRFLGTFGIVFTVGIATGSLLAGLFMKVTPVASIFIGSGALVLVAVLLAAADDRLTDETDRIGMHAAHPAEHAKPDGSRLDAHARHRFLLAGRVANFCTWVAVGITRFLFPKLCTGLGLPTMLIGAFNVVLYCSWAAMFLVLIGFRRWAYRLGPLVGLQLVGALAVFLLWLHPSTAMFFPAFALFGLSAGLTYLSSMFYGQDGATDKGHKSGLHEMILGLGMLAGPFVGGALAELFSLRTPFLFSALVILAAIAVECVLVRGSGRRHRRPWLAASRRASLMREGRCQEYQAFSPSRPGEGTKGYKR